MKSLTNYDCKTDLEKQTLQFANLSNFIALKGGALKAEQMLSGDMADILSNLYLAHSVKWYDDNYKVSSSLTEYCINRLCQENRTLFNRILDNNIHLKFILFNVKKPIKEDNYVNRKKIIDELLNNHTLMEHVKKNIYIENNIIADLIKLDELDINSKEYSKLYDEIIQVGEYKIFRGI